MSMHNPMNTNNKTQSNNNNSNNNNPITTITRDQNNNKIITINDDDDDDEDKDIENGKRDTISIKKETEMEIERSHRIRYGKYIIAWSLRPVQMTMALITETAIGFLAIVTASGHFQTLPSIVSFLYLVYTFVSSNSNVLLGFIYQINDGLKTSDQINWLSMNVLLSPLLFPAGLVLDLVEVSQKSVSPQTLAFATADMVIIIASINFASRQLYLYNAIPLLVSFDFITNFSKKIVNDIVSTDGDALRRSKENDEWICDNIILGFWIPNIVMIIVVITALVLASLSIGLDDYIQLY